MIISKIEIKKFRGFSEVSFDLGSQLTIIAGKNGTQKTTILGMLSQPFTISDKENPMINERPLSGGTFKSAFDEKFKLSEKFDKAKTHEWSLHLVNGGKIFTVESILRNKTSTDIRFWQKGTRAKGSGYIQLPVIFLSLSRLMPIGEDNDLRESSKIVLSADESKFYNTWFKKILISFDEIVSAKYLESLSKNTLGVNTDFYDWKQNSAGQDNIGKILLAIISFKRLKEKFKDKYQGGILAIDELDATLYPGSQIILMSVLRKFASNFKIQIILTTHSLSILEKSFELRRESHEAKEQVKVIFLDKRDNQVSVLPNVSMNTILHRLNETIGNKSSLKIPVYTEDNEGIIFTKAILKSKLANFKFIKCTLSSSSLIELSNRKIPPFIFPNPIR
jgi:AAA15 family ATPase/GTPase